MPIFFARWPDGSFSIVHALDESDAYVRLDEIADEPAEVLEMRSCLLDFELTDSGTFRLSEIGEETAAEILKKGYPRLRKALAREQSPELLIVDRPQVEATERIRNAAKSERSRLRSKSAKRTSAKTAVGKAIQRRMNCSGPYTDTVASSVLAAETIGPDLRKKSKRK